MPFYVKAPSTEREWKGVSDQFERMWDFPHCVGAINGKHIVVQAPPNSGSTFFNYNGTHSVVLMAVCDAHYRLILVDVGDTGRHSDGGVLSNSSFGQALVNGTLPLPKECPLPRTSSPNLPYVFVGDEAFSLKKNLLRRFPGKKLDVSHSIFNYRLVARRVIENSFRIYVARWIFHCPIIANPDNVVVFTKATIALHNYLHSTESTVYCPAGFTDAKDGAGNVLPGSWRSEESDRSGLEPLGQAGGNRYVFGIYN